MIIVPQRLFPSYSVNTTHLPNMLVLGSLYALLLAHSGRAAAAANPTPTSIDINRYPPDPQITACGDIVRTGLKDGPDGMPSRVCTRPTAP
jgi:hypothetical protein